MEKSVSGKNWSIYQEVQESRPLTLWNLPASHAVLVVGTRKHQSRGQSRGGGAAYQFEAFMGEKVPAPHFVQAPALLEEYFPPTQWKHFELPNGAKNPASQVVQSEATDSEKVPAGHDVHPEAPASL